MQQLIEQLKAVHRDVFPTGLMLARTGVLSGDTVYVSVYLGGDASEMINGILQNDPLSVRFEIDQLGDGQYDVQPSASITGLHPDSPYMVYSSQRIRTRKFTGDSKRVVQGFRKLLTDVHNALTIINREGKMKSELPYTLESKLRVRMPA
jgi:hypothetical protein